jgi:protein TonB
MTGIGPAFPPEPIRAPAARLGAAVAASLLVHGWLLSALPIDFPWAAVERRAGEAPIAVRIAPVPELPSDAAVSPEQNLQEGGEPRYPGSAIETPTRKIEPGPALLVSDPRYYLAQELDSYPRPLSPLRLGRLAGNSAEEALLEILVDERGVVQDVIFARPTRPGRLNEELRAVLAATHFSPARKDGRAVRSRVTLRVRF